MGRRIVILGAGFGGLSAANALRNSLPSEHQITLVDRQPLFFMGLTKLWVLDGRRKVGDNPGNRVPLGRKGIGFLEGEVTSIDLKQKIVQVAKQRLPFDYLLVALGADYSTSATLGFSKNAINLYTESGCAEIRDRLRTISSGSITIMICGLPFKCPPAPYEAALLIDDTLRSRGVRRAVTLRIITPEPHPLTILGAEAGSRVTQFLVEREISYNPSERVREIKSNLVVTESGKEMPHTLALAVPVHVAPRVLHDSGLVDQSGWVPVNPKTLATEHNGVYAIGDCAGTKNPKGQLIPRAGILAEEQGRTVAANIIREVSGQQGAEEFEGKGYCFMEVGGGKAAAVRANFYAQPAPTWEFEEPSVEGLREKQRFVEDRMNAWFT